jgi:uncharacterized protein YidB (DUF937 family)
MDIMKMAAELFANVTANKNLDTNQIQSALSGLLGGQGGNLDLGKIVASMSQQGGLQSIVNSWLGDGANAPISPDDVKNVLGSDQVSQFASKLNIDPDTALNGLSQSLPAVVDKASSGGSLLDTFGGVGGLMNTVGKLFK